MAGISGQGKGPSWGLWGTHSPPPSSTAHSSSFHVWGSIPAWLLGSRGVGVASGEVSVICSVHCSKMGGLATWRLQCTGQTGPDLRPGSSGRDQARPSLTMTVDTEQATPLSLGPGSTLRDGNLSLQLLEPHQSRNVPDA